MKLIGTGPVIRLYMCNDLGAIGGLSPGQLIVIFTSTSRLFDDFAFNLIDVTLALFFRFTSPKKSYQLIDYLAGLPVNLLHPYYIST